MRAEPEKRPIHPTFGLKVRWWREERGLGVNALAELAGVSPSLISAYERQTTNPGYESACKVARVLGIHVSMLWDHSPGPDRPPKRRG